MENYYCVRRCYATGASNILRTDDIERVRMFIDRYEVDRNYVSVDSEKHKDIYEFGTVYDSIEHIDHINTFKHDLRCRY